MENKKIVNIEENINIKKRKTLLIIMTVITFIVMSLSYCFTFILIFFFLSFPFFKNVNMDTLLQSRNYMYPISVGQFLYYVIIPVLSTWYFLNILFIIFVIIFIKLKDTNINYDRKNIRKIYLWFIWSFIIPRLFLPKIIDIVEMNDKKKKKKKNKSQKIPDIQ